MSSSTHVHRHRNGYCNAAPLVNIDRRFYRASRAAKRRTPQRLLDTSIGGARCGRFASAWRRFSSLRLVLYKLRACVMRILSRHLQTTRHGVGESRSFAAPEVSLQQRALQPLTTVDAEPSRRFGLKGSKLPSSRLASASQMEVARRPRPFDFGVGYIRGFCFVLEVSEQHQSWSELFCRSARVAALFRRRAPAGWSAVTRCPPTPVAVWCAFRPAGCAARNPFCGTAQHRIDERIDVNDTR